MSDNVPNVKLHDGHEMPQLGFGVFQVPEAETQRAVETALEAGYRSIDTATIYGNEAGVGKALAASGLSRDELFITSKLWITDFLRPLDGLKASVERLGIENVDLYLLHWPAPATDNYITAWQGLEEGKSQGLTKSIGVSNFLPEHLERIAGLGGSIPVVNQIELHPSLQQRDIVAANNHYDIATEAWSPLGQAQDLDADVVQSISQAHGVSGAQVVIRWHIQHGHVVIPKSVTPRRIASNFDVFGFELTQAEMDAIDTLDADHRIGPHPSQYNGK